MCVELACICGSRFCRSGTKRTSWILRTTETLQKLQAVVLFRADRLVPRANHKAAVPRCEAARQKQSRSAPGLAQLAFLLVTVHGSVTFETQATPILHALLLRPPIPSRIVRYARVGAIYRQIAGVTARHVSEFCHRERVDEAFTSWVVNLAQTWRTYNEPSLRRFVRSLCGQHGRSTILPWPMYRDSSASHRYSSLNIHLSEPYTVVYSQHAIDIRSMYKMQDLEITHHKLQETLPLPRAIRTTSSMNTAYSSSSSTSIPQSTHVLTVMPCSFSTVRPH